MSKHSTLLMTVLAVVSAGSVCLAVWAVFLRDPTPVLSPDQLPAAEENAVSTGEDNTEKLPQPQGGGAVSITYSDQVTISLSDQTAALMFANPARSNQSMVLEVVIQDTVVVQSGALTPGTQVETLPLLNTAKLSPGEYEGNFRLLFYDQSSGSKANINTEIPISVTVN